VNPSFCVQLNDVCATNSECCGGVCQKAPGSLLGICKLTAATGVGGCDIAGTVCATTSDAGVDGGSLACGGNCCSRSCAPYAPSGVKVCQPASGCRVNGDLCRVDSDCCGWSGAPAPVKGPVTCSKATPTQEFGRCDNGGSCREAGSICGKVEGGSCNAENNCCDPIGAPSNLCNATPEKCCVRDTLGVPRCILKVTDCTAAPPPAGSPCATSADCCGKPCVSNVCGGTCVPAGGLCTSNADCCPGLPCAIPPGGLFGFCGGTVLADGGVSPDGGTTAPDGGPCALYGQACTTSGECCAGVPCTSGTCRFP
jgi:hypothetical protein